LAKLIIKTTNSKSKIVYKETRSGDIRHSYGSIKETRGKLNFNPSHELNSSLETTVEYFKNLNN